MKDDLKSKLDKLFSAHVARVRADQQASSEKLHIESSALHKFEQVKKGVVQPAMKDVKSYLEQYALPSDIIEEEQRADVSGRVVVPSRITIRVGHSQSYEKTNQLPYYAVTWNKMNGTVDLYKSNPSKGPSGPFGHDGTIALDRLTTDLIENKLFEFIREVVA